MPFCLFLHWRLISVFLRWGLKQKSLLGVGCKCQPTSCFVVLAVLREEVLFAVFCLCVFLPFFLEVVVGGVIKHYERFKDDS